LGERQIGRASGSGTEKNKSLPGRDWKDKKEKGGGKRTVIEVKKKREAPSYSKGGGEITCASKLLQKGRPVDCSD